MRFTTAQSRLGTDGQLRGLRGPADLLEPQHELRIDEYRVELRDFLVTRRDLRLRLHAARTPPSRSESA